MLYSHVTMMKPQDADALLVEPGGKTASMIVAMVKNRQLKRLPPIMAHLRPTLSMNRMQIICAMRAKTEEMPWYLSVLLVSMPICSKITWKIAVSCDAELDCCFRRKAYRAVVLDGGDTSHLHRRLDGTNQQQSAE